MIHQHIKTLPHHPKRVIIISLIIALTVGYFLYGSINKKMNSVVLTDTNNAVFPAVNQNITLGFLAGGRIKSVSVKAGDTVKKGQILAALDSGNTLGSLTQAKAIYNIALANYKKIINGATGSTIDVAKAAVNTAQVNLDGITKQQNILVSNAHTNLLNSTLTANLQGSDNSSLASPSITGTYNKDIEGDINFTVNQAGNNGYVTFSGIVSGTALVSTTSPQALGDTGLYIEFSSVAPYANTAWIVSIPNKNASNYLANYNAYQSALETRSQTIGNAQAALDQANVSLKALVTAARPEDVAVAQAQVDNALGTVQVAQAAYQNTIISAPENGTVVSVAITPGQIAIPNAPAIEFISQ